MDTKSKAAPNTISKNGIISSPRGKTGSMVTKQNDSSLEWYRLTESSRSLLNSVIAATAREKIKLCSEANPDKKRLEYLEGLNEEAYNLTRNGENFESIPAMKAIIEKYKTIFDSLQPLTA